VGDLLAIQYEDVRKVVGEHIVADEMLVVVVGDQSRTEDEIRALELGPIELLTVTDVFGEPPVL
jgi:hypothetical protein